MWRHFSEQKLIPETILFGTEKRMLQEDVKKYIFYTKFIKYSIYLKV